MATSRQLRRRAFLWASPFILIALWLAFTRLDQSIAIAKIDALEQQLVAEGFKVDEKMMMVDEIALGPINPAKRWLLARIIPGYQVKSANRRYSLHGQKLGIDYGIQDENAVGIAVTSDAALIHRARVVAAALGRENPSATIATRVNMPSTPTAPISAAASPAQSNSPR